MSGPPRRGRAAVAAAPDPEVDRAGDRASCAKPARRRQARKPSGARSRPTGAPGRSPADGEIGAQRAAPRAVEAALDALAAARRRRDPQAEAAARERLRVAGYYAGF